MCSRCGDCIEAINAKPEKVKGLEFWHSIGRSSKYEAFFLYVELT